MLKKTLVQRGATANTFHWNYGCCGQSYPHNLEPVETINLYIGHRYLGRLSLEQKALVRIQVPRPKKPPVLAVFVKLPCFSLEKCA